MTAAERKAAYRRISDRVLSSAAPQSLTLLELAATLPDGQAALPGFAGVAEQAGALRHAQRLAGCASGDLFDTGDATARPHGQRNKQ